MQSDSNSATQKVKSGDVATPKRLSGDGALRALRRRDTAAGPPSLLPLRALTLNSMESLSSQRTPVLSLCLLLNAWSAWNSVSNGLQGHICP